MKEILQKIRKPLQIVLSIFKRFTSVGSKTTIVALAMILSLSNVMAQEVTLLGSWSVGSTKAKENGTKRLLVVEVMGEMPSPFYATSVTYGGQSMTVKSKITHNGGGTGTHASIWVLDEAGIKAANETGTIDVQWYSKGTVNTSNVTLYSAFLDNVDQTTPVSDVDSVKANTAPLYTKDLYAANGDMVLQCSGFSGGNKTVTFPAGFTQIFKNPNAQGWGDGINAFKIGGDANEKAGIVATSETTRIAVAAIVVKKAKSMVKTPVELLGIWTAGTTKAKEAGTKRMLVATVSGEISVMNNLTDISLTYGGQVMNKAVFVAQGSTAFGTFTSIFTLNEAGIAAADETGTFVPNWITTAPAGFDIFSAFYDKVDQTTPVSDTSKINLSANIATAPAVAAAVGDMVLMSSAYSGSNQNITFPTGFTQIIKNPNAQSWGDASIAFFEGNGTDIVPSVNNTTSSNRIALAAIVLKGGEEIGVPPVYYTLTANATNGTITANPSRTKYVAGTVVKVKATPNFGYYFINWTDSINGVVADTASIVMNSNKTITANFAEKAKYTITSEVSNGNIYLNPAGGTYYEGVEVTALAKANVGFEFKGWGGDITGTENPLKIVVNSNKLVKAIIEKIPAYTITITAVNGSVKTMPAKATYDPGEAVILIATPAEGYIFKVWEGDLTSTQNPTSLVMNTDKVLKAVFESINGVDDLNNGAEQGMLAQNYPNPFSAVTTIPYQLKKDSHVRLTVYNSLGERITTLVNKDQAAGQYKVDWNAKSDNGKSLANGIYFYRLEIDNNLVQAKKAVITK